MVSGGLTRPSGVCHATVAVRAAMSMPTYNSYSSRGMLTVIGSSEGVNCFRHHLPSPGIACSALVIRGRGHWLRFRLLATRTGGERSPPRGLSRLHLGALTTWWVPLTPLYPL